jgi:hypothetical protein
MQKYNPISLFFILHGKNMFLHGKNMMAGLIHDVFTVAVIV